ncbi:MAG: HDOD domain-containing protein [Desulfobacterales bacterium]|nr:HDOD domain-containing protein [Desulfobacterales bacterium]
MMSNVPMNEAQNKKLKIIEKYILKMPSLSTTTTKVIQVCSSPNTSPNDLNRVISLDPVLTAQVFKVINSAYYFQRKKVTSLTRAIIMLGINTIKNLALSTAVIKSLKMNRSFKTITPYEFWTHSICVGVSSKFIASLKGLSENTREEYFIAGFLHDLGKIPLMDCFASEYEKAIEFAKQAQCSLKRAEMVVIGIDHCTVGKMIGEKWGLNRSLTDSLFNHHNFNESDEENKEIIASVELSNIYTKIFNIGNSGNNYYEESKIYLLFDQIKINEDAISDLKNIILGEIEKAKFFLQIC